MTFDHAILVGSVIAALGPVIWMLITVASSIFVPKSVKFIDEHGSVLGEFSLKPDAPDSVQQMKLEELERLHERVRRSERVRISTAA